MTEKSQDELDQLLGNIKKYLSDDEVSRLNRTLNKLSLFSKQPNASDSDQIINELRSLIDKISEKIKEEAHELDAVTHGGREFVPDEINAINEFKYHNEFVEWLRHELNKMQEVGLDKRSRTR